MPTLVPPVPNGSDFSSDPVQQFLQVIRDLVNNPLFFASTADPGTANVPSGSWAVWKNTTSGVVKLWVNDNGTMKSVTIT